MFPVPGLSESPAIKMEKLSAARVFLIELFFFALTLSLGILTAIRMTASSSGAIYTERGLAGDSFSPLMFIFYFLVATAVVVFISKTKEAGKGKKAFFRFVFLICALMGGYLVFFSLFGSIFALSIFLLAFWWYKRPYIFLHNFLMALGIAGVGAVIGGFFEPLEVMFLLFFFSLYDFIAVYKTKHMVKMAEEMVQTKVVLGFVVPFSFSQLKDDMSSKKRGEFAVLGGGDAAFPLFFASSVASFSPAGAVAIALFSCLGLALGFYLFLVLGKGKPVPALPPIALFSIFGYLFSLLFL